MSTLLTKKFPVDTLQIYFPCSLELQRELIENGFKVPSDKLGIIKTPVPIIYSNFRGWLKEQEPITIERLIPPEWYDREYQELGWKYTTRDGREAYYLPPEEVYVRVKLDDQGFVEFELEIEKYHLERTSIRQIGPEIWSNWAMFYIGVEYMDELMEALKPASTTVENFFPVLESQQKGKERTYYASPVRGKSLGIPVADYSFCLGCFEDALSYLRRKAIETGLNPEIVRKLRLRIKYTQKIQAGLKIGVAKIEGKKPQIMFKLCSGSPIQIKGILKDTITGKARGTLEFCEHTSKLQTVVARAKDVYAALEATKPKLEEFLE